MRKPFIAGNWKMNKTNKETVETLKELVTLVKDSDEIDIAVFPPYTSLTVASEILKASNISLGAQTLFYEKNGAYTGEVSGEMLKDAGCSLVIIGHSERRQYFGCTDELVNMKIKAAVSAGLNPIVCVGETLQERESERTFEVLRTQITNGLKDLSEEEQNAVTIAYEPVWAIGTGKTATPQQAQEAHKFIRGLLSDMYGAQFGESTRILYGGSVKPQNTAELMLQEDVDGGLVGGASLEASSFAGIVNYK